jgi:hypothetical protein
MRTVENSPTPTLTATKMKSTRALLTESGSGGVFGAHCREGVVLVMFK